MDIVRDIHGVRMLICGDEGAPLVREGDANDFLSAAWAHDAALVAIPVARLGEDFFRLRTRLAGDVAQKFVNYQVKLAIVGDIAGWLAESAALRDFVREANHGRALWFVADIAELEARLMAQ